MIVIGAYIRISSTVAPRSSTAVDLPIFPFAHGFSVERIIRRPGEMVAEKVQSFLDVIPRPSFEGGDLPPL